jgi:uncharacterized protein DUF1161
MPGRACTLALLLASAAAAHAARPCEELALEIATKLRAAGIKDFVLEIVPNELAVGEKVVGSCEGGTRKITYARVKGSGAASAPAPQR